MDVIDPPRGDRNLYVVWEGGLDFSLVHPGEIEPRPPGKGPEVDPES